MREKMCVYLHTRLNCEVRTNYKYSQKPNTDGVSQITLS